MAMVESHKNRRFKTVNGEVHTIPHGVSSAEYLARRDGGVRWRAA